MIGVFEALLFAVCAGFIGSILGLGGALILTPILVYFGIPIQFAIAASMVAIIATSSGAASSYVRDGLSNVRAAFYMEMFTAVGAIVGASLTGYIVLIHAEALLYYLFAAFLATSFLALGQMRNREIPEVKQDDMAKWLKLEGSYYDKPAKKQIDYKLTRPALAAPGMFFAGLAAGLLGIGGGAFKISVQEMIMGMPSKVSTATTNFIQGMTALAAASVYFTSGFVYLDLAAPLAIGTTVGSLAGARVLPNLTNRTVRSLFLIVLVVLIIDMVWKGYTS